MPQIEQLIKQINRYIRFEVETRSGFAGAMLGMPNVRDTDTGDEDYREPTEDDISDLIAALSGN